MNLLDSSIPIARGLFIVLEGIDGSGTTSQGERLADRIRESRGKVLFTHQPSGGPAGALIRLALARRLVGPSTGYHDEKTVSPISTSLDSHTFALLFAADRMDHLATQVLPALKRGRHVVCDRYVLSSLAYQGLSLEPDWLISINAHAPRPDLTLFLDVNVERARLRMRHTRWTKDLFEEDEELKEVRLRYHQMIKRYGGELGPIVTIDSSKSIQQVEREIWSHVGPMVIDKRPDVSEELTLF